MKIDVVGVAVDNITKAEAIAKIDGFIQSGQAHFGITPYSEMIVFALKDEKYTQVLNQANLSLPDGIGIIWAAKFLSIPGNFLSSIWQIIYTGAAIIFSPTSVRSVLKEKVSGSSIVYDIAKLAAEKGYSMSLIGGSGNVAAQSAYELKKLYPSLNIKLALSDRAFDGKIIDEIAQSNSDILLIAYSPPRQEIWLAQNYQKLGVKFAIGLGGTFDYLAGKRVVAPEFMHSVGLVWLWRLITQPWRLKRIWNAVPVFIWKIYKYKLNHGSNS